jgi:hypothetical protein
MNIPIFHLIRVLLATGMLTYAAYEDIRTREIHDLVWIIFGVPGIILDLLQLSQGSLDWRSFMLSLTVSLIFSALALVAHLFGEADLLAIITLTILHPVYPTIHIPLGLSGIIFPLTVITNSALIGASSAFIYLFRNLSSKLSGHDLFPEHETEGFVKKLTVLFTGSRIKVQKIRGPPFQYPLENIGEKGEKILLIRPNINDDREAQRIFNNFSQAGIEYIWVSNTLPFLLIIFLGYFSTLFIGDIILSALLLFV